MLKNRTQVNEENKKESKVPREIKEAEFLRSVDRAAISIYV
jgi:hypothetical protein